MYTHSRGPLQETVIAFTDDSTILVSDEPSVYEALTLFDVYGRASGAEINNKQDNGHNSYPAGI
jgi:hypothetical protein